MLGSLLPVCPPQVEAAKEARLKGPHSFPLQRLLTCLSYIHSGRDVEELERVGSSRAAEGTSAARGRDASAGDEVVVVGGDRLLDLDLLDGEGGGRGEDDDDPGASSAAPTGAARRKPRSVVGGKSGGASGRAEKEALWGQAALGRSAPWWLRNRQGTAASAGPQGTRGGCGIGGGGVTCEAADVMSHLSTLASMKLLSRVSD